MSEPVTLTAPTLPQVAVAVPILLEPGIDLGKPEVAAALWMLAALPLGNPVWDHVGTSNDAPDGLDFEPMLADLATAPILREVVRAAYDIYRAATREFVNVLHWPPDHFERALQAMLIVSAGRKGQWP